MSSTGSFTTVFRAISRAELNDLEKDGRFREGPNCLGGKWFADTLQGARLHGDKLYPDHVYWIVEAEVPEDAPSLYIHPNMDGFGPARYLSIDDLINVRARVSGS